MKENDIFVVIFIVLEILNLIFIKNQNLMNTLHFAILSVAIIVAHILGYVKDPTLFICVLVINLVFALYFLIKFLKEK